jgi:hypothetical protein
VPASQIPPELLPKGPSTGPSAGAVAFGDLEAGYTTVTSAHFTLKGYSDVDLRNLSALSEDLYNKIGNDTGLYSFMAGLNFTIVVYKDREEYLKKTSQPTWTRIVSTGTSLYTYQAGSSSDLEPALAHELTHAVFNSFLGDRVSNVRWLVEGLAMYEEVARMSETDRSTFQAVQQNKLRRERMPFMQMTFYMPPSEEKRRSEVYFLQVESVAAYLLNQTISTLNFGNMLNELRTGMDMDHALADNYPGKFSGLNDLENAWKATL